MLLTHQQNERPELRGRDKSPKQRVQSHLVRRKWEIDKSSVGDATDFRRSVEAIDSNLETETRRKKAVDGTVSGRSAARHE